MSIIVLCHDAQSNVLAYQPAFQLSFVTMQLRVVDELKKVLSKDDAQAAARAVLHDAGTFDVVTNTGGFNGSLRFE